MTAMLVSYEHYQRKHSFSGERVRVGSYRRFSQIGYAPRMSDSPYVPPPVWTWQQASGGQFASINRPIAGPTHDKELPVGRHPLQLYSLATPNGVKVTILLEELLARGFAGAEYDAWPIQIMKGEQ